MLHDIGKARIPVAILEKRGSLTQEETSLLPQHPQFGLDALADTPGFPSEMLEVVTTEIGVTHARCRISGPTIPPNQLFLPPPEPA